MSAWHQLQVELSQLSSSGELIIANLIQIIQQFLQEGEVPFFIEL
jgi:hypothetical protein